MERKKKIYHVTAFAKIIVSLFCVILIFSFSACAKQNVLYVVLVNSDYLSDDKVEDLLKEKNLSPVDTKLYGQNFKVAFVCQELVHGKKIKEQLKKEKVSVYVKKVIVSKEVFEFTESILKAKTPHELYILVNKARLAAENGEEFYKLLKSSIGNFLFDFNNGDFYDAKMTFVGEIGAVIVKNLSKSQ